MRNYILFSLILISFFSACVSPEKLRKEYVYFNEGLDSTKMGTYQLVEPIIQKGDLLQITIVSRSSSTNQLFSQNYSSGNGGGAGAPGGGSGGGAAAGNTYLVDITSGDIKLPILGIIHADGISKQDLEREIIKRSSDYLKEDPIVNIRYQNFKVTFLGEVGAPGTKSFESERVTFLEALGAMGGVAKGGDLKNILVFREQNGKRTMHIIDLTKGDFFNSPNYYLKQNDVIYVSPTKKQLASADQSLTRTLQLITFGFSFLNIIFLLFNLFK
jgi:polysaccharide biosynthesis/export protein